MVEAWDQIQASYGEGGGGKGWEKGRCLLTSKAATTRRDAGMAWLRGRREHANRMGYNDMICLFKRLVVWGLLHCPSLLLLKFHVNKHSGHNS